MNSERLMNEQYKCCVECYDIYSMHSHYKDGDRWPPPQKRCRGLRHPFCGFHCSGYAYSGCRSSQHNICIVCSLFVHNSLIVRSLFVHYSFIVGALFVHYSLFRSLFINRPRKPIRGLAICLLGGTGPLKS